MPQVRAEVVRSAALGDPAARFSAVATAPADAGARTLMAADIKRFLERPMEPLRTLSTFDAPPGAPIGGDTGMDWLASPSWSCGWDDRLSDWRHAELSN